MTKNTIYISKETKTPAAVRVNGHILPVTDSHGITISETVDGRSMITVTLLVPGLAIKASDNDELKDIWMEFEADELSPEDFLKEDD